MKPCSIVAAVFLLVAIGLTAGAIAMPKWYVLKYELLPSVETTFDFGLFKTCVNDECDDIEFADQTTCDRTGDGMAMRINAVIGLLFASALTALVGICFVIGSFVKPQSALGPCGLLFCILATTTAGCGAALFVYSIENWYFCDKTYCEFVGASPCTNEFGMSMYLAVIAIVAGIISFVCQLVRVLCGGDEAVSDSSQSGGQSLEPYNGQQQSGGKSANEPHGDQGNGGVPAPPEGDWVYDEASGLYWSDSEYLYLDTVSNQYFDPNSNQWYDPDTQSWYVRE